MKLKNLIESVLTEVTQGIFNSGGKTHSFDLKIKDFQNDYEGLLNHIRQNIFKNFVSEEDVEEFINALGGNNELDENNELKLSLKHYYGKTVEQFIEDILK